MGNEEFRFFLKKTIGLSMAGIFIIMGFLPIISSSYLPEPPGVSAIMPATGINTVNSTLEIEHILRQMNESLLSRYVNDFQNFKTRYAYRGDKTAIAARYIHSVFERNGLEASYDPFVYANYKMNNVVGTKPGISTSDAQVIICAHYDSISDRRWVNAPGADDNGSGIAAVMSAADLLSDYDFNYTIKFIGFCGEELGLKGSTHYSAQAFANGDNITGVINLDMISNNDDDYTTVNIYHSTKDTADFLINFVNSTVSNYSNIIHQTIVEKGASGSTDHESFGVYHYQSIDLMESDFSSHYHTTQDRTDYMNFTYGVNVTQMALASVAELAQLNSTDNAPPSHTPGFPPNNGYGQEQPPISIIVQDPAGINLSGLEMFVNGSRITPVLVTEPLGYNISYVPSIPFSDGQTVNVSVKANDSIGNGFNYSWEFTVDALSPTPPANFSISMARVELVKQGLIMDRGPSSDDIKHLLAPTVIYLNGEYKMWYAGNNNSYYHICYANSTDGLNWTKHGTVLYHGAVGEADSAQANYPEVLYDGEFKMWYSGYNGTAWQILYANSSDGMNWTKHGIVIGTESLGWMNNMYAFHSSVLKDGEYKMWYSAMGNGAYSMIYANSSDGMNWTQYPVDVTPRGSGIIYGDAIVAHPEVILDNGEYKMWYSRYDSLHMRTMYANSSDGMNWNDQGLAIDTSIVAGDYDYFRAIHCSAMVMGNETKVWYSGYNNANWRIFYANLTPGAEKADITLSWTQSSSPDVIRYEIFRESRPGAFNQLEKANPEFYSSFGTRTPWTAETAHYYNISAYGPVTATDPAWFYLPEDNILQIFLFIKKPGGEWIELVNATDFTCNFTTGLVDVSSPDFVIGSTIYATFNYSANRAIQTSGNCITDTRAGLGSANNYFYVIRAVDRVGHVTRQPFMVGKQAVAVDAGWGLLCNPFIQSPIDISGALDSVDWEAARTWNPAKLPDHWTVNIPGRPQSLNTLDYLNETDGIWVKSSMPGTFAAWGRMQNVTYNLKAGWNLVSFPHSERRSASDTLAGLPWDRVEIFDPAAPYLITDFTGGGLVPGQGFWVHLTSDAVWNTVNY